MNARWLRFVCVVALSIALVFVPLEWVVDGGVAWMMRLAGVTVGLLWAFGGLTHLRTWMRHRESGTVLALFRALLGLCVLWTVFTVVRVDLVDVLWVHEDYGGYRGLPESFWLVHLLGGPTPSVMWGLTWASMGFGALMVLGLGGRLTVFAALQTFMAVSDINGHAGGSYDELLTNGLWVLVLAPSTHTLSIDCWMQRGRFWTELPVVAWPRYLLVYQIVLVYWTTGLQKVSTYWVPGGDFSALYYILQQPSWHRFDMSWVAWVFPLSQAATALTWCWEVLAPIWLLAMWFRYTRERPGRVRRWFNRWDVRTWYALIGLSFHIVLTILMDVGPFSLISVCFYICFWHPEEIHRGWIRARGRLGWASSQQ